MRGLSLPLAILLLVSVVLLPPGSGSAAAQQTGQQDPKPDKAAEGEHKPASEPTKDGASEDSQSDSNTSDQADKKAEPPIQRADELKSKVTLGIYAADGGVIYDVNLRHQFGNVTAWVAGFIDPKAIRQARVGAEYDYDSKWLRLKPTLEVGSNGGIIAYCDAEVGDKTYAIGGISRTNNVALQDLYFDPNDSVMLGAGRKFGDYSRIYLQTIFDVRFHTGQQDTHLIWRHRIDEKNAITIDALFKSGHTDYGAYIRSAGLGLYYDRPSWFWKLYYDPHVNFTRPSMVRFGIGLKF
ncbi:MAG TPA: hypothetical protein VEZ90_11970 [Blastocatellia bacterium]|nr:hypothetical protein [Blastocatellia bacterium]